MPLSPGDKLGPYEILGPLGAGGMGAVYRARDTRLGRDVAIKISSAQFTDRFEREARAVAALNHPNICHLYDVGALSSGAGYLVMELIEGQTLTDRIRQGPIPLDEALHIAAEIRNALEAAHDKLITHRDLKPGNVMITSDASSSSNVVKVLDFGLAKQGREGTASGSNAPHSPTMSPTLSIAATEAGMILGTAAYMSPEQAKGKNVDKRADIWAFGVVLYEMLTGERPFHGEDVGDIMASVIKEQPNFEKVPAQVRPLIESCLEKDPRNRLRDIGDAWRLLETGAQLASLQSRDREGVAGGTAPLPSRLGKITIAAAAVFALAAAVLAFIHFRETPPPEQTLRSAITLPENSTVHSFALSPDGRTLVIPAAVNGKQQLWLRPMDALQAQPMAFTEDATYPFWSPDSRTIGFFAQGKLKKVAASGGPAQSLCDVPNARGGSWNRDDVIVFSPGNTGISIQRVAAAGGVPVDVTRTKGNLQHPVFLPDGRHFLYESFTGTAEQKGIYVSSLDGKENQRLLPDVSTAAFAPPAHGGRTGHLLFVREKTLMAAPFDATSAQLSGDVFPVAEGVSLTTDILYAPVTVSENGVLLYEAGGVAGGNQFGWFDRSGKSLGPVRAPGLVLDPAISPDEKSVAFRRASGTGWDLWVRDLSRGTETRFTSDLSANVAAVWSPKGDRIVFASNRKGNVYNLYQKTASGSGQDDLLLPSDHSDIATQWSPDGRFIIYYEVDPKTKYDLWVLPAEGAAADRKPIPFLRTEFNEMFGQLSPDSHWMAFTSDRSGGREVYVRPFPPGEGEWTISIAGGEQPRWRGDGKELFFEAADGKMMAVPVKAITGTKPSFEAGAPVALFDAHMVRTEANGLSEYDVTADGKRFLVNTTGGSGAASPPLTVVLNWQAGLKK